MVFAFAHDGFRVRVVPRRAPSHRRRRVRDPFVANAARHRDAGRRDAGTGRDGTRSRMANVTTARTMAGKTVVPRASSRNGTSASADLSVEVNGLKFMNPFVCGSGPPGTNYAVMKKAFEEGT